MPVMNRKGDLFDERRKGERRKSSSKNQEEKEWKRILIRKDNNLNIIGKLTDNKILGFINENSTTKIVFIK